MLAGPRPPLAASIRGTGNRPPRTECLDQVIVAAVIVFGEGRWSRDRQSFVDHNPRGRTHPGLEEETLEPRPIPPQDRMFENDRSSDKITAWRGEMAQR